MTPQNPTTSPLGYGLSCTLCTCVLPFPSAALTPTMVAITAIQPPLGLGTNPATGALLPSAVSGRPLLSEAVVRRISTARGTLPDTAVPTTVGNYGLDVLDTIDADMTASDCGRLAASIDGQLRQDERVFYSNTTANLSNSILTIVIVLVDGAGPFKLTLAVSLVTNQILSAATT